MSEVAKGFRQRRFFDLSDRDDPAPHIGQIYHLTGFESADPRGNLEFFTSIGLFS